MIKYQCVATGRIYSEEQMRELFRFKEYRGYTGTYEDWIKFEINNGNIINCTNLSLTAEEMDEWKQLKENVRHKSCLVSITKNLETDKAVDDAIDKLLKFEKQHGIKQ